MAEALVSEILFLRWPPYAFSVQNNSVNVASDHRLMAQIDGPLN
jgi:hypothetical protein